MGECRYGWEYDTENYHRFGEIRNEYDHTIKMTIKITRSAVSDNDWVCQMDWVPALSQVGNLSPITIVVVLVV